MENQNHYLVIDDNETDRMLTSILIANVLHSQNIAFAVDGEDGIDWIAKNKSAIKGKLIVFLDIFMPIMNGFQFMEAFMQFHRDMHDKVEIYMLTSSIDPEDQRKARKYHVIREFVNKPMGAQKIKELFNIQ
jgi:CheY-like chemotaxis protein